MSNDPFDDFGIDNSQSEILPSYNTVPTNIKNSRPFLTAYGPLPKMYYDLNVQEHRRKQKQLANASKAD